MTTITPIHGEISRNVRAALNVSQFNTTDLAQWIGVSTPYAYRLTASKRPWSVDHLQVIAEKLGVTLSDLTGPMGTLMQRLVDGGGHTPVYFQETLDLPGETLAA
jgi:hypothetical protein